MGTQNSHTKLNGSVPSFNEKRQAQMIYQKHG